jgi:hypothetical protein
MSPVSFFNEFLNLPPVSSAYKSVSVPQSLKKNVPLGRANINDHRHGTNRPYTCLIALDLD